MFRPVLNSLKWTSTTTIRHVKYPKVSISFITAQRPRTKALSVFSPNVIPNTSSAPQCLIMTAAIANDVSASYYVALWPLWHAADASFYGGHDSYAARSLWHRQRTTELMLRNLAGVHGMEYVIAVPHNIIGPRQKYDDPIATSFPS